MSRKQWGKSLNCLRPSREMHRLGRIASPPPKIYIYIYIYIKSPPPPPRSGLTSVYFLGLNGSDPIDFARSTSSLGLSREAVSGDQCRGGGAGADRPSRRALFRGTFADVSFQENNTRQTPGTSFFARCAFFCWCSAFVQRVSRACVSLLSMTYFLQPHTLVVYFWQGSVGLILQPMGSVRQVLRQ